MTIQRIAIALTIINLVIAGMLLAQMRPLKAQQQAAGVLPILRGRALEIVDSLGNTRASITIQPPVVMDGKQYPQTVLLRLIESNGKPLVKIGAGADDAGISLINASDQGILISARNERCFVKLTHESKERVLEP